MSGDLKEVLQLKHGTQNEVDKTLLVLCVKSIIILNEEMGEVKGKMTMLVWLTCAILAAIIGGYVFL